MKLKSVLCLAVTALISGTAAADGPNWSTPACNELRQEIGWYTGFKAAVDAAYETTLSTGFGLGMWATLMDTYGTVCYVYSVDGVSATDNGGEEAGQTAWLGSRVISMQKANTANSFSLDGLSLPTGAVTAAVYEGGSLYGLQFSNPVRADIVYSGSARSYGTYHDPMTGQRSGGVNVFGGGIALYNDAGEKIGAVGVSGDTSCRDAAMAFNVRKELGLDNPPQPDVLYLAETVDALFEQPQCGVNDPDDAELYGVVVGEINP